MFFKTDKLDYLRSPKTKLFFESFFFIGQGTSSTGKWIWNLLSFSSLFSILGQCGNETHQYHDIVMKLILSFRLLAEQKTFNMEARDNLGSTPLHYACLCGHADLISFLLTAGAIPPKSANNKKRR